MLSGKPPSHVAPLFAGAEARNHFHDMAKDKCREKQHNNNVCQFFTLQKMMAMTIITASNFVFMLAS